MDVPQRRKKIATYGKASRPPSYSLFSEGPSPEQPRAARPIGRGGIKQPGIPEKKVVSGGGGPAKSQAPAMSVFDVPSSDDEAVTSSRSPLKKMRPVTHKYTKTPSEKRAAEDSASEQLRNEEAAAEARKASSKLTPSAASGTETLSGRKENGKTTTAHGYGLTALVSRRKVDPTNVPVLQAAQDPGERVRSKRSHSTAEPSTEDTESTNTTEERPPKSLKSKRHVNPLKKAEAPAISPVDGSRVPLQKGQRKPAPMASIASTKGSRSGQSHNKTEITKPPTIAHVPTSAPKTATRTISLAKSRRNQPNESSVRSLVQQGKSAPALLQNMLPSPETKPSSPEESPSSRQSPATPDDILDDPRPATPPGRMSKSPFGAVTPRQHQAWSNLLDETEVSSPSALGMTKLKIHSVKPRRVGLQRSSSDMTHATATRRQRLIDTLKENAALDDDDDDEEDEDETMVDVDEASSPDSLHGYIKPRAHQTAHSSQGTDAGAGFSQETSSSQASAITNAGPKLTYARTRSYLNEDTLEDELMLGLPSLESLTQTRKPLANDLDDIEESGGGMRSIHELRAAGTARRVVDDIENLLDDIEEKRANSLSRRRSALLELCSKLTDKTYVGRMVDHSLDSRLFKSCASTTDPIIGFVMASAMGFVALAEAPKTALDAMHESGCLKALGQLVKLDNDITKIANERRTNMSRVARAALGEFRTVVSKTLWLEDAPQVISPRHVALKSMDLVVRKLRQSGNTEDLLGYQAFASVAELASTPAQHLATDSVSDSDVALLELVLSILESSSLNAAAWTSSSVEPAGSISQLMSIIDTLLGSGSSWTEQLDTLALRLSLNITNNKPSICDVFATPSLVQNLLRLINDRCQALNTQQLDEEEHMKTLDRLILSLGAMINLAEFSDRARLATIGNSDQLLNSVVRSFVRGNEKAAQADSMEESQSSVAYGYLAVLLGNLCQNGKIREKVRRRLPHERLDLLIRAVEEFLLVHQKVDRELYDGGEGREVWANYTARLQGVIERLKGRPS